MRTPGHDEELAVGFLHGEGLLDAARRRRRARPPTWRPTSSRSTGRCARPPAQRRFYTTSSCGVCGKGALEEVAVHAPPAARRARSSTARCSPALPDRLRQPGFDAHRRPARHRPVRRRRRRCCACARTSAATTRWTRSSAARCSTGALPLHDRRAVRQRAGCRSSSCRRRRWPARRSSSASARRRRWRSSWPPTAA